MALNPFKNKQSRATDPKDNLKASSSKTLRVASKAKDISAKKVSVKKGRILGNPIILKRPLVTERAVALAEQNQYVFVIQKGASKGAVKEVVESIYGVTVTSVRTITLPAKRTRQRRTRIMGTKPGIKKAIVHIKKGQKIEILPV